MLQLLHSPDSPDIVQSYRIKRLSEKLRGSSVLSGLGLSPTHLPHVEEEMGKDVEARTETDGEERALVPEGQQVEVELHELEQHSKPRAARIIPGSIETAI